MEVRAMVIYATVCTICILHSSTVIPNEKCLHEKPTLCVLHLHVRVYFIYIFIWTYCGLLNNKLPSLYNGGYIFFSISEIKRMKINKFIQKSLGYALFIWQFWNQRLISFIYVLKICKIYTCTIPRMVQKLRMRWM